jgi:predicted RNase H-like HicB family nuclease
MDVQYAVTLEPDDGAFSVIVPALPEVHTFGETHEQALQNAHEAIELALRGRRDAGEEIPQSDGPRVERITVSIPAA